MGTYHVLGTELQDLKLKPAHEQTDQWLETIGQPSFRHSLHQIQSTQIPFKFKNRMKQV